MVNKKQMVIVIALFALAGLGVMLRDINAEISGFIFLFGMFGGILFTFAVMAENGDKRVTNEDIKKQLDIIEAKLNKQ